MKLKMLYNLHETARVVHGDFRLDNVVIKKPGDNAGHTKDNPGERYCAYLAMIGDVKGEPNFRNTFKHFNNIYF